jgi:hypothetical protein
VTSHEAEVTTDMDEADWQDVAESEFVDIATGSLAISDDIAFIFDHPDIGLHGFHWRCGDKHLEAVQFDRRDE